MTTLRWNDLRAGAGVAAMAAGLVWASAGAAQTANAPAAQATESVEERAQAAAQASDDASQAVPANSEEIIVTARRRDERLIDVPVDITAVGGATLSKYQVTRITDLATLVPMMIVSKAASGSSASIFLRGVGSTALSAGFDQSVSFVIDGIPMSRGREISNPQFDIQRVEVLKGPQALFFGKNATGGLIHVVSNSPTNTLQAGVTAGYGFDADERYVDGFVSGPLSNTIRARIAGRYSNSDGAFTNTAAATYTNYIPGQFRSTTGPKRGGQETLGMRGTIDWDVTPDFTLELKGGFNSVNDGGPTDIIERVCGSGRTTPLPANGLPPSPNADCWVNGRSDQSALPIQVAEADYRYARDGYMYGDYDSQYAVLTAHVSSDPFDMTSISGYYHFKQTDLNNVSGEAYPASFSQLADFKQFSEELRFQSKFSGPFNILFGAFYSHGEFEFNTDAYIFPIPLGANTTFTTFKRNNGFTSDSMSFFAEGTYTFAERWELAAGARYSVESRDSYQYSLPANSAFGAAFPGGISLNDNYNDTNLSPQVTLRFKPSDDVSIYAAYKQGFKSGGFNISQALTPAATVAQGQFSAETAEGGEIGLRSLLADNSLSFNMTVYHYVYSDLQVQFFDPQAVSLTAGNAGKLTTQGVEVDFNWQVPGLTGFSLRGTGAYNNAKYGDYIGQCYPGQTIAGGCDLSPAGGKFNSQDYDGRTPPKAPRWAGRAGFSYDTPIGGGGMSAQLSSDVSYTSSYYYTDALRPDAIQPGYFKIDAAVSLNGRDDRWTVSLIGRNLTNELVVGAANDIPFAGGTGTGTAGPGVTADMSAFIDNPREIFLEFKLRY